MNNKLTSMDSESQSLKKDKDMIFEDEYEEYDENDELIDEVDTSQFDVDHEVLNDTPVDFSNRRHKVEWEVIKVLRKDYVNGKASAIHIRQGITDSNNITFSYAFGVYMLTDDGDRWIPYHFIPDRFANDYCQLFNEAIGRVRQAMRDAKRDDEGYLSRESLEEEIRRTIRRRR